MGGAICYRQTYFGLTVRATDKRRHTVFWIASRAYSTPRVGAAGHRTSPPQGRRERILSTREQFPRPSRGGRHARDLPLSLGHLQMRPFGPGQDASPLPGCLGRRLSSPRERGAQSGQATSEGTLDGRGMARMKKLIAIFAALLVSALITLPATASAQPAPKATGSIVMSNPLQAASFEAFATSPAKGSVTYTNFEYAVPGSGVWAFWHVRRRYRPDGGQHRLYPHLHDRPRDADLAEGGLVRRAPACSASIPTGPTDPGDHQRNLVQLHDGRNTTTATAAST